jgi:mono/diheme cytochrome c family protein
MKFRLLLPLLGAVSFSTYIVASGQSPRKYTPLAAAPQSKAVAAKQTAAKTPAVTWNKDIAPIVFENCSSCHRPGQVAPFPLLNYSDAKKRGRLIADVTQQRLMPPWKADEGAEKFHDARLLSEEQIGLIRTWVNNGMPEGPTAARPATPQFSSGWKFGEPDATFEPEAPYTLAAEGADVYRCFVIPTNYAEDRYISSIEVQPGNRQVVHHVIAYLDKQGQARKLDEADAGPGYTSFGGIGFPPAGTLGGWAPGNEPRLLPKGMGILLPKGADIVLQVHYHKSGKPEIDRTKIGVTFTQGAVDKRLRIMPLLYLPLRIPAGESNYTTEAEITTPTDVTVHSVMPHMHLLGRQMSLTAVLPDGTTEKLVNVPDWDFNWQTTYVFKKPVQLPAGSKIQLKARYDNSTNNSSNPSQPPREVRWGEETTDEMCIAFLYYTADAEHLTQTQTSAELPDGFGSAAFKGNPTGLIRQLVAMFDENKNGRLDPEERPALNEFIRKNR